VHIVGILPDGRSSGETDTGGVAKEKKEYSEGDIERIGKAKRQAEVALAAIENGGGDARARKLFTNPTNTIAMLRNERAALVAIGQQAVIAPIERSMLIAALDAAAGREKPAKQEPPTLLAKKEKEKLGVMELGLKEGKKEVSDLVVRTLLDTEGLLPWYQKLPEAGQKAFRAVWRGGKFGTAENSTGDFKIGHYLLEHRNEEEALQIANAFAQDPYGTVDALESALLWSSETEDMTMLAFDGATMLASAGEVMDSTAKNILWQVNITEPGEYSLELHGMNKWDLRSAIVFANGKTMQLNRWNQSTDFILYNSTGSSTIEISGIGIPESSHASSGVISLRKIDQTVLGPHLGEATYKNSFTAGVKKPLPGENFEQQVSFGTRMEVMRDLVGIQRFGGGEIEANKPTWIVIHGRESYASASPAIKGTANENNMYRLAEALEEYAKLQQVPQQVLVADWRAFAGANFPVTPIDGITDDLMDVNFGLQGANYIQEVALALHEKLPPLAGSQVNIVTHSWATLVGHDLAGYVISNTGQKVNSFVSLDTAGNSKLLGSNYPVDSVDFRNIAETSWAFEGSIFGSNERSARADITFRISLPLINPTDAHGQVVEVFSDIVNDQTGDRNAPVARHFPLGKLLGENTSPFPWKIDGQAALVPSGYEGIIVTHWSGRNDPKGKKLYEAEYLKYTDPENDQLVDHQQ